MPQLANLVLADGNTTPVNRTFTPKSSSANLASWKERSAPTPVAYWSLSTESREPASPTAAYRSIVNLAIPITATVDGQTKVVRTSSIQLIHNSAQEATEQEAWDLVALLVSFAGKAEFKTFIQKRENFF